MDSGAADRRPVRRAVRRCGRAASVAARAAFCIGVPALIAQRTAQPFVFPSLGPTIFLVLHSPTARAARPRNILLGHLVSALAGYAALCASGLTGARPDLAHPDGRRVAAVMLALALTCGAMTFDGFAHPPGGATTLIVALGLLRTPWQLTVLMASVAATAALLTALRRLPAAGPASRAARRRRRPGPSTEPAAAAADGPAPGFSPAARER
ncbi:MULTISPECIES: HPP family protein [Actinomadura]|uniref:HPP family protein n=1 Tax=Actinomadura yumaensis TaxID=111807 RepID=A0ABW2CSR0_9ACTN|nr:HPP family protein [Actinomadura sp. J1-007]MWK40575.1 HPP family protein [Actinomadura sp. J1-007]